MMSIAYNRVDRYIQFRNTKTDKLRDERPTLSGHPAFHLAVKAFNKASELASRLWKAAQLVEAGHVQMIENPAGHHMATVATVKSQSSSKTYHIMQLSQAARGSGRHANHRLACTCYDYRQHNAPVFNGQPACKHIIAASMQDYINSHDVIQEYLSSLPKQEALQPGEIMDVVNRQDAAYRASEYGQRKKAVFQMMDKIGTPEGEELIAKVARQPQPF